MANLKQLSPAPQVQETMAKITEASYFDEGYLLAAVGILVKCDPPRSEILLSDFGPRVTNLRKSKGLIKKNKRFTRMLLLA